MTPRSPLTNSRNIKLKRVIDTNTIIAAYQKSYDIDVKRFFKDLDKVSLYQCLDTFYEFYFPFNVIGDSSFYEHFIRYDWYYMNWKWEHETSIRLIKSSDNVLEIGCGKGSFVEALTKTNINCAGLELNQVVRNICKEKGLKIIEETIQQHAEKNTALYDVICSFQVIEHIPDIRGFLKGSIDMLKQDGKLLISVPNNNSFLGLDENNILNWPPHHMGLWDERTLRKLEDIFRIRLDKIHIEPLQSYHFQYYINVISFHIEQKYKYIGKICNRLAKSLLIKFVHRYPDKIKGFTMLGEFTKL
jgi:2-polyprenyl-3-methyl-5-hydroxy-6-metoxy-1,4-benzoquinol methylase